MDTSRTSTLDEISQKLKDNIALNYWKGRGNRQTFREDVKKLVANEILTKDEYNYLLKNERRVLVKTQLIHLIPELQSQEVVEKTLKHLSNVVFSKKYKEAETRKEELENQLISQISEHLHSTLHPKVTTINEAFSFIKSLIEESSDLTKEYLKISNQLLEIRDVFLEQGKSPMLLHDLEKLSTKMIFASKSNEPAEQPTKEELISILTDIQISSGVSQ
ncbi:MAG: hypothetical protein GOP50_04210 [Candidatus Heimdallarchaeota archaeon]|nr:hypothetical protein [Candidatus Heimdallarchaeota archaeon]